MIAVLGGTFDPVHLGHVHAARTASRLLGNVDVQMMLAGTPRLRELPSTPTVQRWEMLVLACRDEAALYPNDMEIKDDCPSLTAKTAKELGGTAVQPIVWIVGSDLLERIHSWRDLDALHNSTSFLVFGREGMYFDDLPVGFEKVDEPTGLWTSSGLICLNKTQMLDISGTRIRTQGDDRASLKPLLNPRVLEYIIECNLYRN